MLAHTSEAIDAWGTTLRTRFNGQPIAVCLELNKGPIVSVFAHLQLELLRTHPDKLQPLKPQSPAMRALAQLVEHRRRVVGDNVRITNRLPSALKNYFPHVLRWF